MSWEECVEEAKRELGIYGWVDRGRWNEVIELAKDKYWDSEEFARTKEITIEEAGKKCVICGKKERLTAHHITYGANEKTICLDKFCHRTVHRIQKTYGFVVQLTLMYWDNNEEIEMKYPNLFNISQNVRSKILDEIKKKSMIEKT